jgi:NADH:ubiquinone oxidoreductase subunit 5 (subunit L)/multisubunit Na+/H+ antiporter MnhA subunit/multisubunit Na+/H+ antiporter MnhB subunit
VSLDALLVTGAVVLPCLGAGLIAAGTRGRGRSLGFPVAMGTMATTALWISWLWAALPRPFLWRVDWFDIAGLHTSIGFFVDDLGLLFALSIAGLGALAVLYSRTFLPYYWNHLNGSRQDGLAGSRPRRHEALYYAAILLFSAAMLGTVFAVDLVQIYALWETADIAAFLLIGLNWRSAESRFGATKTLLFTASGGVAILLGIIVLGATAGTTALPELLEHFARDEALRTAPLASVALLLLLAGVAAKSAQVPFHVWLPNAMVAPTPVNAYLDSATLVAMGVYLLARLHPVFAETLLWQWAVTAVGFASIFIGGALALTARDLKVMLAYSTTSQLGFMIALLGLGSDLAFFAALFLFLHHGLLKAGLFFVAGCVTYSTGTTELGQTKGLWRRLPLLTAGAVALALSLGGMPPLAGFWMKETFLESAMETHHVALIALAVGAGALTLTYMLRFFFGALVQGSTSPETVRPLPFTLLLPPLLLAGTTLLSGLWPGLASESFVLPAARSVVSEAPEVEFGVHLDALFFLSMFALGLGGAAFATYGRWHHVLRRITNPRWPADRLYEAGVAALVYLGRLALRLQSGNLTRYLSLMLLAIAGLALFFGAPGLAGVSPFPASDGAFAVSGLLDGALLLVLLLVAVCTGLTVALRRPVHIVLALSAAGFLIAAFFALSHAPNLGLVQVHVETLVTVLFVTALVRLPRAVREGGELPLRERLKPWNVTLAVVGGFGSAWISWHAIESLPRNPVAPWFNEHATDLTHASDIVAAVLVHFRALDTLGEIVVFSTAALGVAAIVQLMQEEPA